MSIAFGLHRSIRLEEGSAACSDEKCTRLIYKGDLYYQDLVGDRPYCDSCGKCVRYSRKKAEERANRPAV